MRESRHPFTPSVLMYAPASAGVYMLWDRDVLIFVGHAAAPHTILQRLMDHYCGRVTPSQATHCGWETADLDAWLGRLGASRAPAEQPAYAEAD